MKSLIKLSDIRNYLIRLNNEHRAVQKIKNKLLKCDDSKIIISRATIAVQSSTLKSDWSKSHSAVLTSVKNADVLVEICFVCHKSDHSFRECLNWFIKVNAVDENYNRFKLNTESEFKSKKLVISSTIIEVKIISLYNLDEILLKDNYFDKLFLIDALLISQNESFSLCSLIDSDSAVYTIIHINLVDRVCKELKIQSISLTKEKLIKEYDEKISKKTIIHKILSNLIIESHKKLTVSMLIADINHHEVILGKSWMNKNEILLNMQIDVIVFLNQLNTFISIFLISFNSKHSSWSWSTSSTSIFQSKISRMLKQSVLTTIQKESFLIWSINVASFKTLLNRLKKNQTEVFALFMKNINREIAYNTQCNLNALNVSFVEKTTQNLKAIKVKLSSKYHEFLDVFDRAQLNKLLFHHFYDHKIELISDSTLSRRQVY